jgi:hypothetical protein
MKSKYFIIAILAALAVGIFLGAVGYWYFAIEMPHNKALALAQKQKAELESMVRTGEVVSVTPDEITIKLKESGAPEQDQVGKEITYKADENTRIQPGRQVINPQGGKIDLTKCVSVGRTVNLMAKGEKIVVLHWDI